MLNLYIQIALTYRIPLYEVSKMSMISEQDLYNAMINHPLYSFAIPYLGYETAYLSEEQILYRKKASKSIVISNYLC